MEFLEDAPKRGQVVRFKKMTKRFFSDDKSGTNFFLNFSAPKDTEAFGILLGNVPTKQATPSVKELESRMNDLGWVSGQQLFKTLGKKKAQALFDLVTDRGPKLKAKSKKDTLPKLAENTSFGNVSKSAKRRK